MTAMIPFAACDGLLDWLDLTDALAAGHDLSKADVADVFLYAGDNTLLNRSAWIVFLARMPVPYRRQPSLHNRLNLRALRQHRKLTCQPGSNHLSPVRRASNRARAATASTT